MAQLPGLHGQFAFRLLGGALIRMDVEIIDFRVAVNGAQGKQCGDADTEDDERRQEHYPAL